jgi:polyphosphate kinase 2
MKLSDQELELLSSRKGITKLLLNKKWDVSGTLHLLKFEESLAALQADLIKLQNKIAENGWRVMLLFEGREFAGKGRTIDAFTEHLNPRVLRVVALNKPNENQQAQWYFKRYIEQLPEKGEMVFFDRSWYNRAVIEPVNGFCTKDEHAQFMKEVNLFEKMLVQDGIFLIKIYLDISKEEQVRRIKEVKANPLERWQLSSIDLNAVQLWDKYTKYIKKMLNKTDGKKNPWKVIQADDIQKGVLEAIEYVLQKFKI